MEMKCRILYKTIKMKKSVQFLKKQNLLFLIESCSRLFYLSIFILIGSYGCQLEWDIKNPYGDVDWVNHKQYKTEFYAHTTRSDGSMNLQLVVDLYHNNGSHILAITDYG